MNSPIPVLPFKVLRVAALTAWLISGLMAAPVTAASNSLRELPVGQLLTPLGRQIPLPKMRPQALALSPDGKLLVVSGKTPEVVVLDPSTGEIRQRVKLPHDSLTNEEVSSPTSPNYLKPDEKGQLSYTGLVFSPDGRRLYLSAVDGVIKVFEVAGGTNVVPRFSWPLPPANAPKRKKEIPSGLAVSPDGRSLFVCGNLGNVLYELETAGGAVRNTIPVGVAPYDVVLTGGHAWVSCWGGRRPGSNDVTGPAGRGTLVRVDGERYLASEGSVTRVDLSHPPAATDIVTGLHAGALAVSPGGRYVVVANAGEDTLSVLRGDTGAALGKILVKPEPGDPFGAVPTALAFSPDGRTLYCANGAQNAVAVLDFDPREGTGKLKGLLPVGWFPGALALDGRRRLLAVANIKAVQGEAKAAGKDYPEPEALAYNTRQFEGSVSMVPLDAAKDLASHTRAVGQNMRRERMISAFLKPRPGQAPVPVPERVGERSTIRHVVYIVKENRTYDQVLGDLARGNGHPGLCIFGSNITPNLHGLAEKYVLLDNTMCCGILSADGHQWCDSGFGNDYVERSFAGFPRSYFDGQGPDEFDALAYSSAGFLWDLAIQAKMPLRNYGEFTSPVVKYADPAKKGTPLWKECHDAWKGGDGSVVIGCEVGIPSLIPYTPTNAIGWSMRVPDQVRADYFLKELAGFEARGEMPRLIIIQLPNDHTEGTKANAPTPAAYVADNDLAFGRIIEGLSKSRFWKETAVFAIEDDPQSGWDHVSGYRTTAYVVSPWAKRGAVVSTPYNTTSMLRTMELILGLPPMNQFDASALPMFDCFTNVPDLSPWTALANRVPLDTLNPDPKKVGEAWRREDALASAKMDFEKADRVPEGVLNRILWRAMKGAVPYPVWATMLFGDEDD